MSFSILFSSGLGLAKQVFSLIKEGKILLSSDSEVNKNHTDNFSSDKTQEEILDTLDKISFEIQSAKNATVFQIIDKIESDKLEALNSRINAIQIAIELEQTDSLSSLHMDLLELTDYARNRITEGKEHWVGAWVVGSATRILLLKMISNSPRSIKILDREVQKFRFDLLDLHKNELLSKNTPWAAIADFVKGENEEILNNLISIDIGSKTVEAVKAEVKDKKSSEAQTVLEPQAAWAFPKGDLP